MFMEKKHSTIFFFQLIKMQLRCLLDILRKTLLTRLWAVSILVSKISSLKWFFFLEFPLNQFCRFLSTFLELYGKWFCRASFPHSFFSPGRIFHQTYFRCFIRLSWPKTGMQLERECTKKSWSSSCLNIIRIYIAVISTYLEY